MEYIIASLLAILIATLLVYKLANSLLGLELQLKSLLLCAACAMFISLVLPKFVVGFAGLPGTLAFLAVFAVVFAYFVAHYEDAAATDDRESACCLTQSEVMEQMEVTGSLLNETACKNRQQTEQGYSFSISEPRIEEEPAAEEPAAEEPAVEEPAAEEPAVEEPAAEEPAEEEPAMEEPAVEEPAVEEPAVEEPAMEEPAVEEPAMEEPAVEEPAMEEPAVEEPAMEEPAVEEPAITGDKQEQTQCISLMEQAGVTVQESGNSIWFNEKEVKGDKPAAVQLEDLLDYAFYNKEQHNYEAALMAFSQALALYPDSEAAPFLVVEVGNLLKNKGYYDEAIKVFVEGRQLCQTRGDEMLEQEFISTIAYLRIIKNILVQHQLGAIAFLEIPQHIVTEIDEEFREWRHVANI